MQTLIRIGLFMFGFAMIISILMLTPKTPSKH